MDYKSSYPPQLLYPFSIASPSPSPQSSNPGSTTGSGQILIISIPVHDLATLGSVSNRLTLPNLATLSLYPHIFAVYDTDLAGDLARSYLS